MIHHRSTIPTGPLTFKITFFKILSSVLCRIYSSEGDDYHEEEYDILDPLKISDTTDTRVAGAGHTTAPFLIQVGFFFSTIDTSKC